MKASTPKPTGEYAVGTFTFTVADDREEILKPSTMRSVACRVYYPVLKSETQGRKKSGVSVQKHGAGDQEVLYGASEL